MGRSCVYKWVLVLTISLVCFLVGSCESGFSWKPFGSSPKLVDEWANDVKSDSQLGKLAKLVCTHDKDVKLIGRISTISKLAVYFHEKSNSSSLAKCYSEYGASIRSLNKLVSISNDNVCSDEKISAIEDFHRRFVSTLEEDQKIRQPDEGQVPRMLLNFFAYYAAQVSRMCKESIIPILQGDVKERFSKDSDYAMSSDGDFTTKLTQVMGNFFNAVHHYEDVLLVWDLAEQQTADSQQQSSDKSMIVDTVDEATGERVKLLVVAKSIRPLLLAQQKCRQKFRPVYSKVILPTVRLANIGYSFTDDLLQADEERLLSENKLAELWYRLTQFCESMLPIQFLQEESLDEQGTAIITLSERSKYMEATQSVVKDLPPMELLDFSPQKGLNTLPEDEDKLRTLTSIDGGLQVRKVNTAATARSRSLRRVVARAVRGLKKVYTGNLHFSRQVAKSLGVGDDEEGGAEGKVLTGDFVVADIRGLLSKSGAQNELQKLDADGKSSSLSKRSVGVAVAYIFWTIVIIAIVAVIVIPLFLIPAAAILDG